MAERCRLGCSGAHLCLASAQECLLIAEVDFDAPSPEVVSAVPAEDDMALHGSDLAHAGHLLESIGVEGHLTLDFAVLGELAFVGPLGALGAEGECTKATGTMRAAPCAKGQAALNCR